MEDGANYTCECDSGYKFDGVTCGDVNECQEEPCGNGECSNQPGSYRSAYLLLSCSVLTGGHVVLFYRR